MALFAWAWRIKDEVLPQITQINADGKDIKSNLSFPLRRSGQLASTEAVLMRWNACETVWDARENRWKRLGESRVTISPS